MKRSSLYSGFTLIEMSMVIVVIALLVAGIMLGRELINASAVRSQITQIEQFYAATNSFKMKYNALPGDIYYTRASAFGLLASNNPNTAGNASESLTAHTGRDCTSNQGGEPLLFWKHLNTAGLINGVDKMTDASHYGSQIGDRSVVGVVPQAKLGNGGNIFVCSQWDGVSTNVDCWGSTFCFTIWGLTHFGVVGNGDLYSTPAQPSNTGQGVGYAVTPNQAYSIDLKMDDGAPRSGKVWGGPNNGLSTAYVMVSRSSNSNCITGSPNFRYNTSGSTADERNCVLNFKFK